MNLITLVPPAAEPVSLEEIYTFLRLDPTGSPPEHPDDEMLLGMITSAREDVEAATKRALIEQTIRLVLPSFSARHRWPYDTTGRRDCCWNSGFTNEPIELPRPPLISVIAVRYYDSTGTLITVDPSEYVVSVDSVRGTIRPVSAWPSAMDRDDAVLIDYVAGYLSDESPASDQAALARKVPARAKEAVKIGVQLLYDQLAPEQRTQLQAAWDRLLTSMTVHTF